MPSIAVFVPSANKKAFCLQTNGRLVVAGLKSLLSSVNCVVTITAFPLIQAVDAVAAAAVIDRECFSCYNRSKKGISLCVFPKLISPLLPMLKG